MRNHKVYANPATDLNKVNECSAGQETCSLVSASVAVQGCFDTIEYIDCLPIHSSVTVYHPMLFYRE